jgi:hypothetical protein
MHALMVLVAKAWQHACLETGCTALDQACMSHYAAQARAQELEQRLMELESKLAQVQEVRGVTYHLNYHDWQGCHARRNLLRSKCA